MKRICLLFLLTLTFVTLQAQILQPVTGYGYKWLRGKFDTTLSIPKDTLNIKADYKSFPHIAAKGDSIYLWSTYLQKWKLYSSGSGSTYVNTDNLDSVLTRGGAVTGSKSISTTGGGTLTFQGENYKFNGLQNGAKEDSIVTLRSDGKLRYVKYSTLGLLTTLEADGLYGSLAQQNANTAAIQQRIDSLRNVGGVLQARKGGVFVPQFTLPTIDTTSLSNRINLKLNITDTANIRLRPIAGSNMTITGTYPNLTFAASGGGGSAAGSTGNVQYNNAGAFAGATNVNISGNNKITITNNTDNASPTSLEFASAGSGGNVGATIAFPYNTSIKNTYDNGFTLIHRNSTVFTAGIAGIAFGSYPLNVNNTLNFTATGPATIYSAGQSTDLLTYKSGGGHRFEHFGTGGFAARMQIMQTSGNVIIQNGGTYTDEVSSRLTVNSTTQGVLLPRMTTTQKLAISRPAEGLEVYDLTLHQKSYYNGTVWVNY